MSLRSPSQMAQQNNGRCEHSPDPTTRSGPPIHNLPSTPSKEPRVLPRSTQFIPNPSPSYPPRLNPASIVQPVLVINAITPSGDVTAKTVAADSSQGLAVHPCLLVVAKPNARVSVVQSCIDLDDGSDFRPKLYNGYLQFFLDENANVTHSYLEESSGMLTANTKCSDEEAMILQTNTTETFLTPRQVEAQRPKLRNTHLETVDVQPVGGYRATFHQFVNLFLRASNACPCRTCLFDYPILRNLVSYILELSRLSYKLTSKRPSLVAAAAVYLARATIGLRESNVLSLPSKSSPAFGLPSPISSLTTPSTKATKPLPPKTAPPAKTLTKVLPPS